MVETEGSRRIKVRRAQFVLKGLGSTHPHFTFAQAQARLHDQVPGAVLVAAGQVARSMGLACEPCPAELREPCLPFVQPRGAPLKTRQARWPTHPSPGQANRLATKPPLLCFVPTACGGDSMTEHLGPRCLEHSRTGLTLEGKK